MRTILVHLNVEIADEDDATPEQIGEAVASAIRDAEPRRTFGERVEVALAEEI